MTTRTVSQMLLEDFSITIRPGAKGECPQCHSKHFSVKGDDSLGKCFHPPCGHFLTTGRDHAQYRYGLTRVLDSRLPGLPPGTVTARHRSAQCLHLLLRGTRHSPASHR